MTRPRQQPMHAGRLRERVRVERPAEARDSGGQPVKTWEPASAREDWGGKLGVRPDASEVVTVRHSEAVLEAGADLRLVVLTQGNRILQAVGVERGETPVWLAIPRKSAGKRVAS